MRIIFPVSPLFLVTKIRIFLSVLHLNTLGCRQFRIESGGRAGDRFGKIEEVCIFCLAEIKRVVQLLKHNQLCAMCGTCFNAFGQVHHVYPNIRSVGLLDKSDFYLSHDEFLF